MIRRNLVGEVGPLRLQVLVGEVVARKAVELVGACFGRHGGLDRTGASEVNREGVGLDGSFADRVRIGRQVWHTRAHAARDIESVEHVKVAVGTAPVSADIHRGFRVEVVGGSAESSDPRGQGRQGDEVAAGKRQIVEGLGAERELVARFSGIEQGASPVTFTVELTWPACSVTAWLRFSSVSRVTSTCVVLKPSAVALTVYLPGGEAEKAVNARAVRPYSLRLLRAFAPKRDVGVRQRGSRGIGDRALQTAAELRVRARGEGEQT